MTTRIRCAIYTRKSSEEGLEQSFNSLDAQREACEAYILSQRHEGWQAIGSHYDDGGFSGGSMERPALQQLMTDISAGKINTVVVYKVDRLTRSLTDFAKIIELFDSKQVSFVSVTQQFNTTTSMGRLTLNVLLSFAQFEREVTGERIRDKIAASKKKGMWMGGFVPLGYDLDNRKLIINQQEAATVREIYQQYLRLGCVSALKEHLDRSPTRSKVRVDPAGNRSGGCGFSRGALYQLLRNHIYVGEIEHKGNVYVGQHQAIIDRNLWDNVQQSLTEHRQGNRKKTRAAKQSLLTGLLFDEQGNRYTPTHAIKNGRRYRYYTSQAVIRKTKESDVVSRFPAYELECAITERVAKFVANTEELLAAARELELTEGAMSSIVESARRWSSTWETSAGHERANFLRTTLQRVAVQKDSLRIELFRHALFREICDTAPRSATAIGIGNSAGRVQTITIHCPLLRTHRGKELKLIIGDQASGSTSAPALIKAIARARSWYERIVSGQAISITDLAAQEGIAPHYVSLILPCALLSPHLVEEILYGRGNPNLILTKLTTQLPLDWQRQTCGPEVGPCLRPGDLASDGNKKVRFFT
jgi:DNA invertase Pin-like site-specific DNA recombinase